MPKQTLIHEDSWMKVELWSNPGPVSIIVTPKTGHNIGDDEEVTMEFAISDIRDLLKMAEDAGIDE